MSVFFKPSEPLAVELEASAATYKVAAQSLVPIRDPDTQIRVIVIDDDLDILESIVDTLCEPLFLAHAVDGAQEFFALIDALNPHVVLIDLQMPGLDGIDVLEKLRERAFGGEIVLISGMDTHVLQTARRMGTSFGLNVTAAMHKPFSPSQLLAAVDSQGVHGRIGEMRVRSALNDREIRPYFQPKITLATGAIAGAEALSRWHHPQRGLLLPGGYLKTVRAGGGQGLHDFSILEGALEACAKLNAAGHRLTFSVNFTADVVLTNEFPIVVKDALQRHAIAPDQFIIELTETDAVENMEALTERLLKLRLHGIHLSIDDFGTGHSSLTRIQQLPVSEIKIDRSFVAGLTEYSDDFVIVRAVVDLAHAINCPVVAEGVETLGTLEALRKVGCDMAQGHIFSPAVNEQTFLALVNNNGGQFPGLKDDNHAAEGR